MILILRGHIRDSFNNTKLYNLVKDIVKIKPNIKIFIHTWNVFANSLSWRIVHQDNRPVTNDIIYEYFKDLKGLIKHIIIDDDKNIKLIGNLDGKVPGGNHNLRGWKNYIYGKYKIIEYIYNKYQNKNEMVINCRFDVLGNSRPQKHHEILNLINNNKHYKFDKNLFLRKEEFEGIDNIYIGNIETMFQLTKYFYYELDKILMENNNHCSPEMLWFRMNILLFVKNTHTHNRKLLIDNYINSNKKINIINKVFFYKYNILSKRNLV